MVARASIYTLGCRTNQADAALMASALRSVGFEMVPWGEDADLVVINSCTVTAAAAQKTRQAARAARRRCGHAYVVLAGCEVNVGSSEWNPLEVVDLVVGNPDKMAIAGHLPRALLPKPEAAVGSQFGFGDGFKLPGFGIDPQRTRANLKIQEGCDGFCSYCIVPYARGLPRSRDWDDILREAAELAGAGCRELVIAGINIAKYDSGGRRLADLLPALLAAAPACRIRLGSIEPCADLSRVVALMGTERRLCRFLHLPLQYGEDTMLKAMNRPYSVDAFTAIAESAAARIPGLCLGSDIIVGFPGETDEQFATCLETVARLPFAYLHVFRYSPRPGTPAATMPGQVPGKVAAERQRALAGLARRKATAFARSQIGEKLPVLTENINARQRREGWSDNYLRVELPDARMAKNQFVVCRVDALVEGRYVKVVPCLGGMPGGCG